MSISDIDLRNTTLKSIKNGYPKHWKIMQSAYYYYLQNSNNTQAKTNTDKIWTLEQIEKVNQFTIAFMDKTVDPHHHPKIDFEFQVQGCRVVRGMVKDIMPCSCCRIWKGFANIKDDA